METSSQSVLIPGHALGEAGASTLVGSPTAESPLMALSSQSSLRRISKNVFLDIFKQVSETLEGEAMPEVDEEMIELVCLEPESAATTDLVPDEGIIMLKCQRRKQLLMTAPFSSSKDVNDPTQPVWWYIDESENIQGPFSSQEMDWWFKEGYFSDSLRIRIGKDSAFVQLKEWISVLSNFRFNRGLNHQNETKPGQEKRLSGSCLLYTSPSPRDRQKSRMPSSA
eukprot:TRINITY_DN5407_c0_g1_i2.p1 TRINITY_DN5407_c0_g1~~TRINITY_DN5407_c0_g1_i2.p1  ORF type:complete len:225 (+),score=33.34 TRINITY_DN5407_c0_g1_i2:68-742(+)